MQNLSYRKEIDGLRAVAVLSVIFFHAGVQKLSGGFIGVDIFYVISGFLITKIIITSLECKTFTFVNFYVRRIKRLLPAAAFMLIFTLLFGAFMLFPGKYVELSKSAVSSCLLSANFWFMNHSGYFDQETSISPLVHMWSLSIEEQFYLVFPVLIVVAHRFFHRFGVKILLISLFSISLFLSVYLSRDFPNFSFYMLPTRAWELCMGAFPVLMRPLNLNRKILGNGFSVLGICLVAYGLISISDDQPYPAHFALIPTSGLLTSRKKQRPIFRIRGQRGRPAGRWRPIDKTIVNLYLDS